VFVEQYEDQALQLGEGQAMGWFSPDETHQLKMVEHDRAVVYQMKIYLNQLSEGGWLYRFRGVGRLTSQLTMLRHGQACG
jgi:hypothetical protein